MNICKFCHSIFDNPRKWRTKTFCNRSCSAKFRGKTYIPRPGRKTGKEINCLNCSILFYVRKCETKKRFCSQSCSAIFNKIGGRLKNGFNFQCPICKNIKYTSPSIFKLNKHGIKFCSVKCKNLAMKTGITSWSFQKIGKLGNNPRKRIQVKGVRFYEHRNIIEKFLGRKLEKFEHIHHINGDPKDNRIENLQIVSNIEHGRIHKTKKIISS